MNCCLTLVAHEYCVNNECRLSALQTSWSMQQISQALSNSEEIKEKIKASAKNWKPERMSKIDLTILYLAVEELAFAKSAPKKVIINEAIEMAKKYSSAESPAFINGILDNIAKDVN